MSTLPIVPMIDIDPRHLSSMPSDKRQFGLDEEEVRCSKKANTSDRVPTAPVLGETRARAIGVCHAMQSSLQQSDLSVGPSRRIIHPSRSQNHRNAQQDDEGNDRDDTAELTKFFFSISIKI